MDWQNKYVFCLFFLIHCVWLTEFPPPQHIQIKSSVLMWDSPRDDINVTYTIQYSTVPAEPWNNMTGCSLLQCDFTAKDFYGKVFRVRAEKGNLSSVWQQSEQVQCAHINTCAPLINLTVTTDKVHLWMAHRDKSLKKEFGSHISFRTLYWKTTSPNAKQEPDVITNPLIIRDLKSGENYCFQVEYLYYHKPYGQPSSLICKEIPETSVGRTFRIIVSGVIIVVGLVILGSSLYFVYNNYRKIKQCLHPPLDIPDHFQEFFLREFSEHQDDHPSYQDTEVCNITTFASEEAQLEPEAIAKGEP